MAANVVFYNFPKKINSTKRPDANTESVTYSCNMLDDCSIISPKISIAGADNTFNPRRYNYAYIADFDRWYFVSDWVYSQRIWNAMLSEDVLASWKNGIGNSKQYITRASAALSNNIIDGRYATTTTNTKKTDAFTTPFVSSRDSGTYIISVLGNGTDMIGYYAMNRANYINFATSLFGSGGLWEQLMNDLVDPLQYIISVRWFPISYDSFTGTPLSTLFIGFKAVVVSCKALSYYSWTGSGTVKLSEHPLTTSLGPWVNSGPYTRRSVYWPPIGEIPLNCIDISQNVVSNIRAYRLTIIFTLDIPSGMGTYQIKNADTVISSGPCKLAVDLPLAGQQVDFGGILGGALQTIGSAVDVDPVGTVSGVVDGVKTAFPQVLSRGSTGSVTVFSETPVCISIFYSLVNRAPNIYGYPAMFEDFVNAFPGYLEVEKPVLSIPATDQEIEKILSFMREGFYYE